MNTSSLFARRLVRPAIFALAIAAAALVPLAHAQAPAPVQPASKSGDALKFDAALALFQQAASASGDAAKQKWQDAMVALEGFRNEFKGNSPQSIRAKYLLGIVYIQVKNFDDAAREFRQLLADPKMDPGGKEEIQLLIAKALTLKGVSLPSGTQVQKGAQTHAFQEAITEYDKFLADYPATKSGDTAHYLRASLLMSIEGYDESVKGFATVVTKYKTSPLIWPSQLNIGKARMNQGYALLAQKEGKDPKPEDVTAALAIFQSQALPALDATYLNSRDLALMNESVFYIGQIRLTIHQNEPATEDPVEKKKQDALLMSSLDAFRAVRSREEVVGAQEQKIEAFKTQLRLLNPADVQNYTPTKNYLEGLIEIEEGKKAKFLEEQDQFLGARLSIAQIFRTQKKYDECRVLIRYLQGQKDLLEKEKEAQANIANILAMSYIEQKNIPKGMEACEAFRANFKGNAAGEALPLAMAALLVEKPDEANVVKAESILKQAREDYKPWRYESQSVQVQVGIYLGQKKYPEALGIVDDSLKAPGIKQEVEVESLFIKAGILRTIATEQSQPAKADEAIRTYKVIRDKFPGIAKAEDAWFEELSVLQGRNPATAQTGFQQFIDKFKGGGGKSEETAKHVPVAQFNVGRILQTLGKPDDAIKSYQQLWEKWPESEPTPNSYFKVFDIQMEKKDYAGANKTMETYLQKYPKHEYSYYAYNNQAEILFSGYLNLKKGQGPVPPTDADLEAGTKKLMDYVDFELAKSKEVTEQQGPKTLLKISDRWKKTIPAGLPYFSLNSAQKLTWQKAVDNILTANEKMLKSYLDKSEDVLKSLGNLGFAQKEMVKAKVNEAAKGEAYFAKLIEQYGATPEVKSKILFAEADFIQDFDPEKARKLRDEAVKINVGPTNQPTLTPDQHDTYLTGLFEKKQYDEMTARIAKIRAEYPLPKDEAPDKASKSVQDGQAVAFFWEGKILAAQGKTTEAGAKFGELKNLYSKSGKVLEADFGIIQGNMDMNPPVLQDDYIERLTVIVKKSDTKKSFELPAKAVFLSGRIFEAKGQFEDAVASFKTVAALYKSVPAVASESLWRAAQILKKQATGQIPVKTQKELREEKAVRVKALAEKQAKKDAEDKAKEEAAKKKGGGDKGDKGDKAKGDAKPEAKGETKAADPAKPEGAAPEAAKADEKSAAKPDAEKK